MLNNLKPHRYYLSHVWQCALEQDFGEGPTGGCGRHRERDLPKSRRQERVRVSSLGPCLCCVPLFACPWRLCVWTYHLGERMLPSGSLGATPEVGLRETCAHTPWYRDAEYALCRDVHHHQWHQHHRLSFVGHVCLVSILILRMQMLRGGRIHQAPRLHPH